MDLAWTVRREFLPDNLSGKPSMFGASNSTMLHLLLRTMIYRLFIFAAVRRSMPFENCHLPDIALYGRRGYRLSGQCTERVSINSPTRPTLSLARGNGAIFSALYTRVTYGESIVHAVDYVSCFRGSCKLSVLSAQ